MEKILVCNQKMFLTHDEANELSKKLREINFDNIKLIICPSYLNFDCFKDYNLGSQDCHYERKGAFTSKISSYDLSLIGVKYGLVGHSELRDFDTDEIINKKIKSLLSNSMVPILCIGETKYEKEMMKTPEVLKRQLEIALKDISLDDSQQIYIAYEPRYLIGTKKALNKNEVIDTLKFIKKIVEGNNIFNYKLLYGGAVNNESIKKLNDDMLDGFLLGTSSVSYKELNNIVLELNKCKEE